jgi:hypothetical protein
LLGEGQVDAAATNLKRFAEQIDSQRSGSPAFLAVICGKGYGYRRACHGTSRMVFSTRVNGSRDVLTW